MLAGKVVFYSSVFISEVTATNPTHQSGKSGTIRESNQASGVRNAHYAYVQKALFC